MTATSASLVPRVTSQDNAQRRPAAPGGTAGVDFKFEARDDKQGSVVKITESFAGGGAPADQMHFVRPESELGLARIERTYYDGQVEHAFFFAGRTVQDALAVRVLAIPLPRWKQSASGLDGGAPLEVAVPAE
jgi:hypothetical protein